MNVTPGWKARPIFYDILARWATPHELANADISELVELLYPLGLFNQRAKGLVKFSQQYIDLGWPSPRLQALPEKSRKAERKAKEIPAVLEKLLPQDLDVRVFYGAGRYASDSFRIYSDLMPGGGGPSREAQWLDKRSRAIERRVQSTEEGSDDVGAWLSDEEGDDSHEEWRSVVANGTSSACST
jgi:hypothetical protein